MSLRNTLRKAAGLLVELPPETPDVPDIPVEAPIRDQSLSEVEKIYEAFNVEAGTAQARGGVKTVEQIVREAEGPNLDQVQVPANAPPPPIMNPDGGVNFQSVYASANLPSAPMTAEQVIDLFASLPAELPLETKRQTVKVSIQAMGRSIGATPENIVADASRKLAALTAYSEGLAKETTQVVAAAEAEITNLEQRIEGLRKSIAAAQQRQAQIAQSCLAEADRLDDVLEFFSLDVPPSKYAASVTSQN